MPFTDFNSEGSCDLRVRNWTTDSYDWLGPKIVSACWPVSRNTRNKWEEGYVCYTLLLTLHLVFLNLPVEF